MTHQNSHLKSGFTQGDDGGDWISISRFLGRAFRFASELDCFARMTAKLMPRVRVQVGRSLVLYWGAP